MLAQLEHRCLDQEALVDSLAKQMGEASKALVEMSTKAVSWNWQWLRVSDFLRAVHFNIQGWWKRSRKLAPETSRC